MAMFLFLDSNLRNALDFGGRQLGTVFPEDVQRNAHSCSDWAATISQISYRLCLQTPGQRAAIILEALKISVLALAVLFSMRPLMRLSQSFRNTYR